MKKVPDTSDNFDVKSMLKLVGFVGECGHRRYTLGRSSFFSRLIVPKRSHCKSNRASLVSWWPWVIPPSCKWVGLLGDRGKPPNHHLLGMFWKICEETIFTSLNRFFLRWYFRRIYVSKSVPQNIQLNTHIFRWNGILPGIFLGAGRWKCLRVVFLG